MPRGGYGRIVPVLSAVWLLLGLCGCAGAGSGHIDRSIDTWSAEYADSSDKLAVLAEYLQCPTDPLDAEYHIAYWDNSGGLVPGPSDWRIDAALLLDPADLPLWLEGMEEVAQEEIDMDWWAGLDLAEWPEMAAPQFYKRPESRSWAVADPASGALLKHIATW